MSRSGVRKTQNRSPGVAVVAKKKTAIRTARNSGKMDAEVGIDANAAVNEIINFQALSTEVSSSDPLNQYVNNRAWIRRYGIYILGVCILATIIFLFYQNRLVSRYVSTPTDQKSEQARTRIDAARELEQIASLIIQDREWNYFRVNKLSNYWRLLDLDERVRVSESAWYQHFVFLLQSKLQEQRNYGSVNNTSTEETKNPLIALAMLMELRIPAQNTSPSEATPQLDKRVVADIANELGRYEAQQVIKQINESKENRGTLQQEKVTNFILEKPAPIANTPVQQTLPEQQATRVAQADQVLQQYVSAYERGNTDALLALYQSYPDGENDAYIRQLKTNFEFLFGNSSKRSLYLGVNNWSRRGDRFTAKGDYNAKITLKNNKGTQTINADLKLEMQRKAGRMQIVKLQLLNRKVTALTPELSLSQTGKAQDTLLRPTAAELQDIVTRFTTAYETGDLKLLKSLFTKNAKTNDKNNRQEIVQDYTKLFTSTADRQLFIQDLDWSYNKNYAKGSGKINAIVLASSENNMQQLSGKIQIVAKKVNGNVLITHLYHLMRAE